MKPKSVVIRTDASVAIGTGHVMRCLTLAERLRDDGAEVTFICRDLPGNLCDNVSGQGFAIQRLPVPTQSDLKQLHDELPEGRTKHAEWLGVTQDMDASQTIEYLTQPGINPAWLVVDHYGIDSTWERQLRPYVNRIMVIDDLADRLHDCDVLLDQNFYTDMGSRYRGLLPPAARQLLGPHFALLRPEFRKARELLHKRDGTVKRIFVFFGGVDPTRETEKVLDALDGVIGVDIHVDVVVGSTNPHKQAVLKRCEAMPNTTYYCQVSDMAVLMARADLSFGAGGVTTWERCCMALPSIVVSVADNQERSASDMADHGMVLYLGRSRDVTGSMIRSALVTLQKTPQKLQEMGSRCRNLVDGDGTSMVASFVAYGDFGYELARDKNGASEARR